MSTTASQPSPSQRGTDPGVLRKYIRSELAYRQLSEFVRQAWPIVEPGTDLAWNWHLDLLCDALEQQIRGDRAYRKLLICIPPGTMKSLLVSVFAPAWEWLHHPERRKLFLSNDDDLASRDSRRMREVVNSDWYQGMIQHACTRDPSRPREPWSISKDQNEKVNFENTRRGFRQSRSFGSKLTGKRGDGIVIDDPMDAREVINGSIDQVAARLAHINNIIEKVLPSRVNRLADATWTIIMQRLHLDDPAGRAMQEGGWQVVVLPMEYVPGSPHAHPEDPRTEPGELLFPELFPREELDKMRVKLHLQYDAQYQQDPRPGDAAVLKRWYWRFWYPAGADAPPPVLVMLPDGTMHECVQRALPERVFSHTQSWDMAFKDTKDSAYVVGQVWAERDADSYLLDQVRDRMDINATLDAVRLVTKRWPMSLTKLVEDKANGSAVLGILQGHIPGLLAVNPQGGKETRMNGAAPVVRSGNIYLPHPHVHPWVNALIDECESAPFGKYMDQVDSLTQYVIHRYGDGGGVTESLANW